MYFISNVRIGIRFKFAFFICLILSIFACSPVFSANHTVTGSTFDDIQNTIDISTSNDIIILENKTYTSTGSYIMANKSHITIQGESSSKYATLDAGNSDRVFFVNNSVNVTFKYIHFINGNSDTRSGGAIRANGTIHVDSCTFKDNKGESGGAIFIGENAPHSTITNSQFTNNQGIYHSTDLFTEGGAIDTHA